MTKKKDPKDYKKMGRPTLYSPELADEICDETAANALGLETLCKLHDHWPERVTINRWLYKYPDFCTKYAHAKEQQVETSMDLLMFVLEEDHHYTDSEGNRRADGALLRVKLDAIKWNAGKLKRKKYGDDNSQISNNQVHDDTMAHKAALDEQNKKEY